MGVKLRHGRVVLWILHVVIQKFSQYIIIIRKKKAVAWGSEDWFLDSGFNAINLDPWII